jgi:hypothetical protein
MEFFTNIELERYNSSFTQRRIQKVPIQYCQTDKWIQIYNSSSARKQMDLESNIAPVEMQWILPRISVNLINVLYDAERHQNKTVKITQIAQANNGSHNFVYAPVPYNLEIELCSISKNLDDAFQIMEQIIPYFSPDMSIDVKIIDDETPESIPVTLNTLSFDFPQEISQDEERLFTVTYGFTMRSNYYFQQAASKRILHAQLSGDVAPIDVDGTQTLFEQYVSNALLPTANPEPPDGGTAYKDTTQVCLIDKGAWVSTNTYKNYDFISYGGNKFIWIGGSVNPNIEPGTKGWEKCWTLQTVLQNMGVNFNVI